MPRRLFRVLLEIETDSDPAEWDFDTLLGEPELPGDEPDNTTVVEVKEI